MDILKELILDSIEAFLLLKIFSTVYNQTNFIVKNKIRAIIFCVIFVFGNFWVTRNILLLNHTLILAFSSIILLKYITKITFFESAVVYSLFFTILATVETVVLLIEMFMLGTDLNHVIINPIYMNIFLCISKILQITIVLLLAKLKISFSSSILLKKESSLISYLILQMGIFSLLTVCLNFSIFDIQNMKLYNAIIMTLYVVYIIMAIKDSKERERLIDINSRYTIQGSQIKNMEEIISIIRQEKHDFANHINVIQAMCFLEKPNTVERIKDYVATISGGLHASFKYLNTGNDYIDAILSIKSNYAVGNHIKFDVTIKEPFSTLCIKQDELISIISNLVDNAFEALKSKTENECKKISISTYLKDKEFCIEVANNGDVIPLIIVTKIFDKGYSTKQNQGNDHGYGLFITRQFVEQNNGVITVKSTEEKTRFLIRFKLEDIQMKGTVDNLVNKIASTNPQITAM